MIRHQLGLFVTQNVRKKGAPLDPGNKLIEVYDSAVRGLTRLLKSVSDNYYSLISQAIIPFLPRKNPFYIWFSLQVLLPPQSKIQQIPDLGATPFIDEPHDFLPG